MGVFCQIMADTEQEATWKFKLVLLGDPAVGKTSLVYRFIENRFRTDYKSTLGVNLLKKDVVCDGKLISLQIWDLGGQQSFRSLRKLYLEGSNGGLLIFDMTNPKSFEDIEEWLNDFKKMRGDQPLILIGNKSDLTDKIAVQKEVAKKYAEENKLDLIITSAKSGEGVEEAFLDLTKDILSIAIQNIY